MFKFIDLFAGIGGFRTAIEKLGMKCVFSSENDPFCQDVYETNFGERPSGDITKINPDDIPDFDILAAGFPCQPFSYAGLKEGFRDKVRGTLFFNVEEILRAKTPKMFILENVKGIKTHDRGETVRIIHGSLKELGYTTYSTVLNSHDFGVPQYRERWYCVGFDKKIHFEFPVGSKRGTTLRDIVDAENNDPSLKLTKFELDRIDRHFKLSKAPRDRVKHNNSKYNPLSKKGKHGIFSYLKPDGTLRFHVGDFAKSQIQEAYYASLDNVSCAIIASREPKLWDLRRKLSVEECKRLQGFPPRFKSHPSAIQAKKQYGNSITVPVIEAIVSNMLVYYKRNVPDIGASDSFLRKGVSGGPRRATKRNASLKTTKNPVLNFSN